jgi:DNA polymerase-1
MRLIFDIETDGLNPSVVWVLCAMDEHGVETTLQMPTKADVEALLKDVTEVVGHNIISFDVPALEKVLGVSFDGIKLTDTLVMSRLYNPQLEGGHSLDSWGQRLKFPKGDFHDWSKLTPEMVVYCQQDVRVTEKLYRTLADKLAPFGDESIELEHRVQSAIVRQIKNGWLLDQRKAFELSNHFRRLYEWCLQNSRKMGPCHRLDSNSWALTGVLLVVILAVLITLNSILEVGNRLDATYNTLGGNQTNSLTTGRP